MFKLYKKLRPIDWVLLIVLVGLTVLQVYCTMLLVDYTKDIIQSITLLDYFNHPEKLDEAGALAALIGSLGGWGNVTAEALAAAGSGRLEGRGAYEDRFRFDGGYLAQRRLMLAVALGSAAAQCAVGLIASYVSAGLSTNIRSAVYKKVDSFSASEVDKFSTPSLITRTTNDVQQVQIANIMMLRMVVAAPITAVWAICKIRATSMQLTWATIVAVVLMLACITAIMIVVMPKFKSMQKLTDKLNGVSRENLTGIRVVRAYNAEGYQEEKFEKANVAITKTQLFTGRVMALMSPIMTLIMNGISLALYWIGASLINKGTTDFPTISSFMMLASQIIMAFMMLMMMFVLLPRAQVSAERINRVLGTEVSVKDPETDAERTETGTVEFKNVTFRYPDSDEAVIKNISFRA
ncbi:MAG: ABC transporter ATP-binding protein, partial [Christensenellaceae bacterium]